MRIPSITELDAMLHSRGHIVEPGPRRLQIVVLRRLPGTLDAFDDMLITRWSDAFGEGHVWACRCTADPGKPAREHPTRRDGTAVWAEGQVVGAMQIGMHKGQYECLVPAVPIPVLRYTSADDPSGDPSTSMLTQIHRASATHESTVVGPWSEGCIVVANPVDFAALMARVKSAVAAGQLRFTVSVIGVPA